MDITLKNVTKSYGDLTVLRQFNHTFREGETTCIMGPSGCGKTTLLRLLMGLEKPDEGEILGLSGLRMGAVFQEYRLCENLNAISNVRMVCSHALPKERITQALTQVGITDSLSKPVRDYSGGMKRRVAIVRAVLSDPEICFLDEPFEGLDEATRSVVGSWLYRQLSGKTVLMVSHDEEDALRMDASVFRLDQDI